MFAFFHLEGDIVVQSQSHIFEQRWKLLGIKHVATNCVSVNMAKIIFWLYCLLNRTTHVQCDTSEKEHQRLFGDECNKPNQERLVVIYSIRRSLFGACNNHKRTAILKHFQHLIRQLYCINFSPLVRSNRQGIAHTLYSLATS